MAEKKPLKITYKTVDEITPNPSNSRTHSDAQIEQLKDSIKTFGMNTPIGIREGVIIYGHARYEAMKQLGHDRFPTLDLSHMTETEARAYVIADNKLALNADWNMSMLEGEIDELMALNFDISVLGFDEGELNFDWDSDIGRMNSIEASDAEATDKIVVTVPRSQIDEIRDLVLDALKKYSEVEVK